ncbi:hypothetical protein MY3296_009596 [Beauveria thailandica]
MAVLKGLLNVLGVFAKLKEAKAPEPRPKALEAPPPVVGEARALPGLEGKPVDLPSWRLEEANLVESPVALLAGLDSIWRCRTPTKSEHYLESLVADPS